MNLSEHFTLAELTATTTGLANNPGDVQIDHLKVLASGLELVRSSCGNKPIKVNSGFRSVDVNLANGGAKNSAHLDGYAADIVIAGMTNQQICQAIYNAGIKFDQMIDENSKGGQWVHISFAPAMRNQWLIFSKGTYVPH